VSCILKINESFELIARLTEISANEESRLVRQVRELENLLKKLAAKQTAFLEDEEVKLKLKAKPVRPQKRPIPIADDDDEPEFRGPVRQAFSSPPVRRPVERFPEREDVDLLPAYRAKSRNRVTLKTSRAAARSEADEVLHPSRADSKAFELDDDHVNELIRLPNRLQQDYRRLREYYGDARASDASIDELSQLNESMVTRKGSPRQMFD
jgi:hypothetical protein